MNRSGHSHFNPWLALVVVCLGQFMVVLDATIVNVALPSIQADLHISDGSLQWIVNAYTLLFGGFLLLGGRAADLLGRRTLFIAGVVVFSVASFVNALATSQEMLIAARGLQGLGGALLSPAALAVITTSFAEGRERTRALSVWAAIASGGSAAGLLLGGVLVEFLSWEWIFFVNVPIGVAHRVRGAAVRARLARRGRRAPLRPRRRRLGDRRPRAARLRDRAGRETGAGARPRRSASASLALALLGAFIAIERRSPAPLVRLDLFRLRSLATANGVFLLVIGGLFAMFFFASLYLQNVLGYSALTTGLAFLPGDRGIMIGATAAQQLISRVGVRAVMITGMTLAAAGLAVLAATTEVGGSYLGVLGGLLPMSIGMGATFVPLTLVATTNVEADDAGLASGIFNTSQQVGGALGLAILSTLANDRTATPRGSPAADAAQQQAALVEGFQLAFFVAAALIAVGAILAARAAAPPRRGPDRVGRSAAVMPHTFAHRHAESSPALRADAARNRQLILAAAAEVFAERGLEASTAEIARRAGVGEATLFRRFPTKDDLIVAIVAEADGRGRRGRRRVPAGARPVARPRALLRRDGRAQLARPRASRRGQGSLRDEPGAAEHRRQADRGDEPAGKARTGGRAWCARTYRPGPRDLLHAARARRAACRSRACARTSGSATPA